MLFLPMVLVSHSLLFALLPVVGQASLLFLGLDQGKTWLLPHQIQLVFFLKWRMLVKNSSTSQIHPLNLESPNLIRKVLLIEMSCPIFFIQRRFLKWKMLEKRTQTST